MDIASIMPITFQMWHILSERWMVLRLINEFNFLNDELIFSFFDVDEQLMIQLFEVWITNKDVAKGF